MLEEECTLLHMHTMPLPLPPFYMLMTDVDHYLKRGKTYRSDSFYSHPGGYKMNVVVASDDSISRNHLSAGVCILRGEFDDQLKWPFDGEVTIQAYNRTQRRWAAEMTVALNNRVLNLVVVKKRRDSLLYAHHVERFLRYSKLELHYAHDFNIIRLRVTKVKVLN